MLRDELNNRESKRNYQSCTPAGSGSVDGPVVDSKSEGKRRMSKLTMWLLLLAPMIAMAAVGWFAVDLVHIWATRKDWELLGSPPGSAVAFYENTQAVVSTDGQVYLKRSSSEGWELAYRSQLHAAGRQSGYSCPTVWPPGRVVQWYQDCAGYSDNYYAILKDGSVWHYLRRGDDNSRGMIMMWHLISRTGGASVGMAVGFVVGAGLPACVARKHNMAQPRWLASPKNPPT